MKRTKFFLHLMLLFAFEGLAGQDSIVVYNYADKSIQVISPLSFDTIQDFGMTGSSRGTMGDQIVLDNTLPTMNVFPGTQFSDISPAINFFDLEEYPVRTAVRLRYWRNDTLRGGCSGQLVGDRYVLTAAHCIYDYFDELFEHDSVLVLPGHNNGVTTLPTSVTSRAFIFKSFYDKDEWIDIGLLELKHPIGNEIGWVGIGYSDDTTFYNQNTFHKFSYPGVVSPWDTSKVYNGDTMYYNYGGIKMDSSVSLAYLIVDGSGALGIPGQSGSSLFYTNNDDTTFAVGVLNWASNYRHLPINEERFYALESILNGTLMSFPEPTSLDHSLVIYPNPMSSFGTVRINAPRQHYTLSLFNSLGSLVRSESVSGNRFEIIRGSLETGLYLIYLKGDDGNEYSSKLLIR